MKRGIDGIGAVSRNTQYFHQHSVGGTQCHDTPLRWILIADYGSGRDVHTSIVCSIQRWIQRVIPYRMMEKKANRGISGKYLLWLVIFKFVWSHSTIYEYIAFIAKQSTNARIFNVQAMSKALCRLGYTTKVTSTVAYQAFTDRKLLRWHIFWSRSWPLRVHGTPQRRLLDIYEFRIHLNNANGKYGASRKGLMIWKPGNYDQGTFKLTVIMVIERGDPSIPVGQIGSTARPRNWLQIMEEPGTTVVADTTFVGHVLDTYPAQNNPTKRRTVIHNNLTSRVHADVYKAARKRDHSIMYQPLYHPQDGPVEVAINQAYTKLELR